MSTGTTRDEIMRLCPFDPALLPRWQDPRYGKGESRFWTRERTLEALRAYVKGTRGTLPVDRPYDRLAAGTFLPPQRVVLEHFGSVTTAWIKAANWQPGRIPAGRLSTLMRPWEPAEDEYVLDNAGTLAIATIARRLNRTHGAVKRRMYELGVKARTAQGYLSIRAFARLAGVDTKQVANAVKEGWLPAHRPADKRIRNRWHIDPEDATPEIMARFVRRERNWSGWPHEVLERAIRLRNGPPVMPWREVARLIGRDSRALQIRIQHCYQASPLWRAAWYVAKEFEGRAAIIDIERVLRSRGIETTYAKIRAAAAHQPKKLRIDGGVLSVVTHTSSRIRPDQRLATRVTPAHGEAAD